MEKKKQHEFRVHTVHRNTTLQTPQNKFNKSSTPRPHYSIHQPPFDSKYIYKWQHQIQRVKLYHLHYYDCVYMNKNNQIPNHTKKKKQQINDAYFMFNLEVLLLLFWTSCAFDMVWDSQIIRKEKKVTLWIYIVLFANIYNT